MSRWTASQVDRNMVCLGSASLPQVHEDAPAATRGTEIHARVLDPERCPAAIWDWLTDGYSGESRGPDSDDLVGFEVTFAWSPETFAGRVLGANLNRDYSAASADEITGTADAVAWWLGADGWHIRIGDLKTGHSQVHRGTLPPAGESWQLRTLAIAVADIVTNTLHAGLLVPKYDIVSCKVAHFLYDGDGLGDIESAEVKIDEAEFTIQDLHRFSALISDKWNENKNNPGQSYHRGSHCGYCPSFDFCPAQQASLRALAHGAPQGSVADTWIDLRSAKRIVEQAEQTLLTRVEREGGTVHSRPGYELALTTRKARRIDGHAASSVLARIDERLVDACVRPTVTQESLSDGLKALNLSDFSVANVMTILTDAGAVIVDESKPFLTERRIRNTK